MGDLHMETFDNTSVDLTQPLPRHTHTATAVGSRIYVFRGEVGGTLSNEVQILHTEYGNWTTMVLGTKPSPQKGHSAVAFNNDRVLIVGGNAEAKDRSMTSAEQREWSSLNMARGLKKHLKRLNAPKHRMLDKLGD